MDKNLKTSLEYCYIQKNGLRKDLISKFDEGIYRTLIYSNLIIPCVRSNGNSSWKISKQGYDLHLALNPQTKYKHWTTKIQDFLENAFHYKFKRKEYLKNLEIEKKYFKEIEPKNSHSEKL